MRLALTYRRVFHDRALDQHRYVTTRNCEPLGVPAVELAKLAARGGLTRVGHGVYRFDDIPASRFDGFMEAVFLVGPNAHLSHDAVLALHDVGLGVPRSLRVSTRRPKVPVAGAANDDQTRSSGRRSRRA